MAINDLINSYEILIDFLKQSRDNFWVTRLEDQKKIIKEAYQQKDTECIKKSVGILKSHFGGMGSLNDLYICKENKNIPPGMSAKKANKILSKLLDDLFMWCFFWNIETNIAKKIYAKYLKSYHKKLPPRITHSEEEIERYIKNHT